MIKYKYSLEIIITNEEPTNTPGIPIIKRDKIINRSELKERKFLNEPPIPSATVAILCKDKAW